MQTNQTNPQGNQNESDRDEIKRLVTRRNVLIHQIQINKKQIRDINIQIEKLTSK